MLRPWSRGGVVDARIFISYSSRDRPAALQLLKLVEDAGHDAWMDLFDIRPAQRLRQELEEGVRRADVFCILLSPAAVAGGRTTNSAS